MKVVAEKQHPPILAGLSVLAEERGWVLEVMPLVTGQRSVRDTEWLLSLKKIGISAEEGKRIIRQLGLTLLTEHETELFESYWRQFYGPLSNVTHLLGQGPRPLCPGVSI